MSDKVVNYANYVELAIVLIEDVLVGIKGTEKEQEIAGDVRAALDALLKVRGTEVSFAQLESLRVQKTF